MAKHPAGFVALKSLRRASEPVDALSEIRHIYFNTTRETIDNDLAHAIELLKGLPSEQEREKATVYMQGLSEMRREWLPRRKKEEGRRKKEEGRRRQT